METAWSIAECSSKTDRQTHEHQVSAGQKLMELLNLLTLISANRKFTNRIQFIFELFHYLRELINALNEFVNCEC